jgi:hypothetical protein
MIEAGVPTLVEAHEIIAEFLMMIRRKAEAGLTPWIARGRAGLVASFVSGVAKKPPSGRQSAKRASGPLSPLKGPSARPNWLKAC